ncbi:MAG TPA: hypothetical protein VNZ24_06985, partial [Vicinamibacterales bacterium]|nr:hypothetical protein [Vicinamibacterales bacterium]
MAFDHPLAQSELSVARTATPESAGIHRVDVSGCNALTQPAIARTECIDHPRVLEILEIAQGIE